MGAFMTIRLGVIGLSPGNGHPYSWSAICNGYDREAMEHCGFPVIPRYLEERSFPTDQISGVQVTHVWAQHVEQAVAIAKAALIPNVVDHYTDMIGQVDAILLARDDAENHLEMSRPFLQAGLPIYVDKPLALSRREADEMLNLQRYEGQLFSCSALKYAPELIPGTEELQSLGKIRYIHGFTPKYWNTYAVHLIDPVLRLLGYSEPRETRVIHAGDQTLLTALHETGVAIQLCALGNSACPIDITVVGESSMLKFRFKDSFTAFRAALQDFVDGIQTGDVRCPRQHMQASTAWVKAGSR